MSDGNVPISHVVQVVRNDTEKVGYVCRPKNPLGRHVAAELKRTALLEDMKPWFGTKAKSLVFFFYPSASDFFISSGIERITYQLSRPLFHLALRSRDMNGGSQEDHSIVYVS